MAREGAPTASSYSKRREARNEDIFESLYQQPLTNSANSQTNHSVQPVSPARCWPWFGLMLITRTAHLLSLSDSTELYPWQSRRCFQYPKSSGLCACVYVCVHMRRLTWGKNCRREKFSAQLDLAFSIILFWLAEQALSPVYVLTSLNKFFLPFQCEKCDTLLK